MQLTTCATGWRTALLAGALLAIAAAFDASALPPAERVFAHTAGRFVVGETDQVEQLVDPPARETHRRGRPGGG